MRCVELRHVTFEDLGVFRPVLEARGFAIESHQAGVSPLAPAQWLAADLIVVLGGPIGVYESDRYPWIADEVDGLRARLSAGGPTLGICLGAQLMARALGARVYPGPAKEIGWSALTLTEAGSRSSLARLEGAPVLHWHGDTFDLPEGTTRLASTALTPNQAFALGETALALQFHAEADGAAIEPWLIGHTCELIQAGVSVPDLRAQSAALRDVAASAGAAMLSDWLDRVAGRQAGSRAAAPSGAR